MGSEQHPHLCHHGGRVRHFMESAGGEGGLLGLGGGGETMLPAERQDGVWAQLRCGAQVRRIPSPRNASSGLA